MRLCGRVREWWSLCCSSAALPIGNLGRSKRFGCWLQSATSCLWGVLCDRLGARHASDAWRTFPALALHHATQDTNKLGSVFKLSVIHCFLRAVYILNCASSDAPRGIMVVDTIPQERAVLERDRQTQWM